jgi:[ribosomal protein S5]-alanine N-acetyltransferase
MQLYDFQNLNTMATIGYFIKREYWNRGISSSALKEVCRFAFDRMHIKRLEAYVHVDNIGSYKTLEKVGFLREGLLRKRFAIGNKHEDCYIYSLLATD